MSSWEAAVIRSPRKSPKSDGVVVGGEHTVPARAVVVAADAVTAARLLPDLAVPAYRTVTTYYHLASERP
ncbi:hypothetical protein GCM10010335_68220 [Streptomyces galbus]|nr:hypothetical protein GCM10010335_68220 [Streptomyces galbus]